MDKNVIIFRVRRYLFIGVLMGISSIVFIDNMLVRIIWFGWMYTLCTGYADNILRNLDLKEP